MVSLKNKERILVMDAIYCKDLDIGDMLSFRTADGREIKVEITFCRLIAGEYLVNVNIIGGIKFQSNEIVILSQANRMTFDFKIGNQIQLTYSSDYPSFISEPIKSIQHIKPR